MTKRTSKKSAAAAKSPSRKVARLALLAGGNPQIATADGNTPVRGLAHTEKEDGTFE